MTDDELIGAVGDIRRRNNGRWIYDVAQVAMELAPEKALPIMRTILEGNAEIERCDQQLIDGETGVTDTEIIDRIQAIRATNNGLWMHLLRLAFEKAPERARAILKDIVACDREIQALSQELVREGAAS